MQAYIRLYAIEEEKASSDPPTFRNLEQFPPSFIVMAQFDVPRDQGRVLAKKLEPAGRSVKYKCIQSAIHTFATREMFA
jgi:acetyl esterase/lipase